MDVLNMTAGKGVPKVLLFLAEGFEDLEAVSVLDVCGWTQYREHIPKVRVVTTGIRPEVKGRFGLQIRPDLLLRDVRPGEYAALAIPGGFFSAGYGEAHDPLLYQVARSIHGAGGTIATMCVGILPVAEAGLLRGKAATTYFLSRHRDHAERLRASGCTPARGPIEVCDRIISCSGPAHSVEVALLLLESLIGPEAGREVRRFMAGME
jgi:4-methyl-5(b-hydroxyethyl)-thiazole monophosphate biosynthesis